MISPWYFVCIAALIFLAAFFSAAEMAFSSANRLRLEGAMEAGSKSAKVACYIFDNFEQALSAILIGNNIMNIGASSLTAVMVILLSIEQYSPLVTAILTILIIIFAESMPKILAKKNANRYSSRFAYPIRALMFILYPITWLTTSAVGLITRGMKDNRLQNDQDAVDELVSIIDTVEDEGVIDEDQSELLHAVLDFSEISASEIMTARVDMEYLDIDDDIEEILDIVDKSPYSRIPVYEDNIDNIIGILYLNHLFKAQVDSSELDIRSLLIKPCYVYKTVKLPAVLEQLRQSKMHMAVVTDDYGGTMGIVTMEDVLEQLVGEIWDETDEIISDDIILRDDHTYEVDGDTGIYDMLDALGQDEDDFEMESLTVGGWTTEIFGGFPETGDSIEFNNLEITVLEMEGLRVAKVLIRVRDGETG